MVSRASRTYPKTRLISVKKPITEADLRIWRCWVKAGRLSG
jgi:hypothetical protein